MSDKNTKQNIITLFGLTLTKRPERGIGMAPPDDVYRIPPDRIHELISALRVTLDPALYAFDKPIDDYGMVSCRFTPECDAGSSSTCHLIWTFNENDEWFYRIHLGRAIWIQIEDT